MKEKKQDYMDLALKEATKALKIQEVPVGALIVDAKGIILSKAHNETRLLKDPTAHAEILAIRRACEIIGKDRLENCDIYVTLEPCPMCAQAIAFSRIRRLYFGAYDPKGGGVDHGPQIFNHSTCHYKSEVYGGLLEKECELLLKDFFKLLRK